MLTQQVIQETAKGVLPTLPQDTVHLVVIDPTYLARYKDRSGRTLANDDNPAEVVGATFLRSKASDCDKQFEPSTRDVSDKAQPIATDRNAACDEIRRNATDCNGMVGVRGVCAGKTGKE